MKPIDDKLLGRLLEIASEASPDVDFGKYELLGEIGRGGMGIVYEARDTHLGRRVALKCLAEHAGLSMTLRQRFVREATAAGRLQHPHIAQVFDATPDYIAMQYVDGNSLLELDCDAKAYARLLADAARAVQHAHEHGIIHRDLKPSNILVEDEQVYVVDFGLAKETATDSSLSLSGSVLGTPAYMPPEQAQGRLNDIDERSDVYSLGATLYTCLAGRPPFEHENLYEILRSVVERDPARLTGVEVDLATICRKAMTKEPEHRYASAREFAEDLDRYCAERPVLARPPSLGYHLSKVLRRHRGIVRGVVVVAVLAAIVTSFIYVDLRSQRQSAEAALQLSNTIAALLADAEDHGRASESGTRDEKLERAEADCRAFLDNNDAVAQAHYLLGRVLRQRDQFDASRQALDRALELNRDLLEARFERGMLLISRVSRLASEAGIGTLSLGHFREQARKDLARSLSSQLSLRTVDRLMGESHLAILRGEPKAAQKLLKQVILLDSRHVEAYLTLLPLLDDSETKRSYSARLLDVQKGFSPTAQESGAIRSTLVVGKTQVVGARGLLVDLPTQLEDLPNDVLVRAYRALERTLRAETLFAEGLRQAAVSDLEAALEDLDYALGIAGAVSFSAGLNNRAIVHMRLAEFRDAEQNPLAAVGSRVAAGADLDQAITNEADFLYALINRALLRMAQGERQAAGQLPDLARRSFGAAATDAERALELCGPVFGQRPALVALWSRCRDRR